MAARVQCDRCGKPAAVKNSGELYKHNSSTTGLPCVEAKTPAADPVTEALGGDVVAAAIMRRVAEQFPGSATAEAVDRLDGKLPPLPTPDESVDPTPPDTSPAVTL